MTHKRSITAALLVAAAGAAIYSTTGAAPVRAAGGGPAYTSDGKLLQPKDYRNWVFIGSMVTPNGLNNGKAGFPEFHNVYVEQRASSDTPRSRRSSFGASAA